MKEKDFIKKVFNDKVSDKEKIRAGATDSSLYDNKRGRIMKYRAVFAGVLVIVAVLISSFAIYSPPIFNDGTSPKAADKYSELISVIEDFNKQQNSFSPGDFFGGIEKSTNTVDAPMSPELDAAEPEDSYSSTNVQTEGMDEGDIVKVDGQTIYKLSSKGCVIIEATNGDMTVLSRINIDNYVPQELYLSGNKLIIIGGVYNEYRYTGAYTISPMYDYMCCISYNQTDIRIYDVSDKREPVLDRKITTDGYYFTSRLIEETNELLYMVNYNFYYGNEDSYVPKVEDSTVNDGVREPMPVEDIYYYEDIASFSYLVIGKININDAENDSEQSAFLGLSGTIYVSEDNIFVATYDYKSMYKENVWGWVSYDNSVVPITRIVKIAVSDLKHKASGKVDGTIKDRYSMDEYQGYLRVATTVSYNQSYNMVYVLKSDLTVAGKIDNIAPGEAIYSVRFNGTTGSLVTFEQVDPYYNLDLSDPNNPEISSGLKEDGVSYYIHYIEGTNYTIGVGRNTEVVYNPFGNSVQWRELKVSLYDNSSGEAVNVKTVYIPEEDSNWSCYSELFYNPKALLYQKDLGLFAFSYEAWSYESYYYNTMKQGLAVLKFDLTAEDENKLILRGTLNNLPEDEVSTENWYDYYDAYFTFVSRGVQIGEFIYTVSDRYITSYDLENLTKIESIDIYEEN